jgi:hypothetical protein
MSLVTVNILAEDNLCEALARRLLLEHSDRFFIGVTFAAGGYTYIKDKLAGYNRAAVGVPLFVLTDLVGDCPVSQIKSWLPHGHHNNLIFRIAVKESEAWILADTEGFSRFLGISMSLMPTNIENISDPKQFLINLAARSRRRTLREALVPKPRSTSLVGPDYNSPLTEFIEHTWNPHEAARNSQSLNRTIKCLENYHPSLIEGTQ